MPDLPRPTIHAFLACDYVIEDSLTRKRSLIGIFTHLQAASFPFQHQQLGLYFCMTDAEGTYHFDIDLVYLPTEELVCRASLPTSPSPTGGKCRTWGSISPSWSFLLQAAMSFACTWRGR